MVSNSRNKIHQTWPKPFSRALWSLHFVDYYLELQNAPLSTSPPSCSYYNSYSGNMHHVAMSHHNSHLAPLGASPQYTPHTPASQHQPPPPPQRATPASTPVSRRTSVDSNPGKGTKRKRAAGYDHNGMLSEVIREAQTLTGNP